MKIMSVDYGTVRTGIAVCDKQERLASPVTTITEYHSENLPQRITEIAKGLRVELIVVGLPRNMDGSEGESARNARKLAADITAESGIETVMWDERCTTVSAHGMLSSANVRGARRKKVVDCLSAVLILEDYLAYRRNRGLNFN